MKGTKGKKLSPQRHEGHKGQKAFTTEARRALRAQSFHHRGTEGTEGKRLSPQRHRGHRGQKAFTTEAQRAKRAKGFHHKGTKGTKGKRLSPQRHRGTEGKRLSPLRHEGHEGQKPFTSEAQRAQRAKSFHHRGAEGTERDYGAHLGGLACPPLRHRLVTFAAIAM